MGDIRFSYNDDFNKTFLRPSQFVADRFLRCKSMVFVVRKYGICGAKVWYLWCKSMVFVVRKYGVSWVYVGILQFVRSVVADRQQHYRNPSAALSQSVRSCRGPIYRAHIYVNTHVMGREMRVR